MFFFVYYKMVYESKFFANTSITQINNTPIYLVGINNPHFLLKEVSCLIYIKNANRLPSPPLNKIIGRMGRW